MPDIDMFGLTYTQRIEGFDPPEGLHIEPGIWVHVPPTTDPQMPPTVVRMASIPHGTTILAQGKFLTVNGGPQIEVGTSSRSNSASPSHPSRKRV